MQLVLLSSMLAKGSSFYIINIIITIVVVAVAVSTPLKLFIRPHWSLYCPLQDLTALAKELRAVDDVRPPHKVTDYSSSSEESGTTDEEDDEEVDQEAGEESTSGAEDSRAG